MITIQKALELHKRAIQQFGGSDGLREINALESALARPYAAFGGEEFYPDAVQKAAALLESVVKNHPFVDGNKRTGYALCAFFLFLNGMQIVASEDDKFNAVVSVASGDWAFDALADWLKNNVTPI